MPQTALMPGTEDRVGYWLTPPDLMASLQAEFDFTFDACPYPRPAGFDGLKESWGTRTWVNPPWMGGVMPWVRKAIAEARAGKLVVVILSGNRVYDAAGSFLDVGADVRVIARVPWVNPKGESQRRSGCALLFILRPFTSGPPRRNETESR